MVDNFIDLVTNAPSYIINFIEYTFTFLRTNINLLPDEMQVAFTTIFAVCVICFCLSLPATILKVIGIFK